MFIKLIHYLLALSITAVVSADGRLFFYAKDIVKACGNMRRYPPRLERLMKRLVKLHAKTKIKDIVHKDVKLTRRIKNTSVYCLEEVAYVTKKLGMKEHLYQAVFKNRFIADRPFPSPTSNPEKAGLMEMADLRVHDEVYEFQESIADFTKKTMKFYKKKIETTQHRRIFSKKGPVRC